MSPLRRAIETCLIALDWLIADGVPIEPDARWQGMKTPFPSQPYPNPLHPYSLPPGTIPHLSFLLLAAGIRKANRPPRPPSPNTENYPKPCDTGSPPSVLAAQFPQVDFSHLDPVYPDKTSPAAALYHCNKDAVIARGEAALRGLYGREENVIVVVSHSGFMRTAVAGRWFANADWRGFDFVGDRGDEGGQGWGEKGNERPMRLRLVEWEMTKGKGGMGRSREERVGWGEGLPEVKELN